MVEEGWTSLVPMIEDWHANGRTGHAWPTTLTVASDSHSNHYGGIGALGTPVVRTDAASIWSTSKTWWQSVLPRCSYQCSTYFRSELLSKKHFLKHLAFEILFTVLQSTPGASVANEGYDRIPPIAKITFTGVLPRGVTGKDVIVALCGLFNQDDVLNHALEFTGSDETLASIPIDARLTIANMTTEWGALSGMA